jgi:hypothetical protein
VLPQLSLVSYDFRLASQHAVMRPRFHRHSAIMGDGQVRGRQLRGAPCRIVVTHLNTATLLMWLPLLLDQLQLHKVVNLALRALQLLYIARMMDDDQNQLVVHIPARMM